MEKKKEKQKVLTKGTRFLLVAVVLFVLVSIVVSFMNRETKVEEYKAPEIKEDVPSPLPSNNISSAIDSQILLTNNLINIMTIAIPVIVIVTILSTLLRVFGGIDFL